MNIFTIIPTDHRASFSVLLFCLLFRLSLSASNPITDPALTLNCPADITIHPAPGQCIAFVEFATLNYTFNGTIVSAAYVPGEGSPFEYGNTPVLLEVTDINGDEFSCEFLVTVEPNIYPMICNPLVPVYLGDNCNREITPFMVLEGGPYDCEDAYHVKVINPNGGFLGSVVDTGFIGTSWDIQVESNYGGDFCTSLILVLPDSIGMNVHCPPNATILCHEPYDPSLLGAATVTTCLEPADYAISYTDVNINSFCNGDEIAFIVDRIWKVTNVYDVASQCHQTITAMRVGVEDIIFPPDHDGIDEPVLSCSDGMSYEMVADTSQAGVPTVNGFYPAGITCSMVIFFADSVMQVCGQHYEIERYWTVIDFCANETRTHTQKIIIDDTQAPTFDAPSIIPISTQSDCGPFVYIPPISNVDECATYSVEIRTPWDTLYSNGGFLTVPVNSGNYNAVYVVKDACLNTRTKTAHFAFTNNVIASCPGNKSISCNLYHDEIKAALDNGQFGVLQQFGNPILNANCGTLDITESAINNLNACSEGIIVRTMTVEANGQQHSCHQNISVYRVSDFVVEFPVDSTFTCLVDPPIAGEPIISGADCENIQVNYTDQIVAADSGACYKIIRTWVVSNPCVAGSALDNEVVEKPESQLGLPFPQCDLDGDGDCDDHTFRDSWTNTSMPGIDQAHQATGFDTDPDADPWDGYIVYQQSINVIDIVAPFFPDQCALPEVCVEDPTCQVAYYLPNPLIDECSPLDTLTVELQRSGTWFPGFGPHNLSPGIYPVRYMARDLCNNQKVCQTTLVVKDCTPPVAKCDNNVVVQIPATGIATINASTLDNNSFDNCATFLQFSFSADINNDERTYTCDSLGLKEATLWVTDYAGNQSSCTAFITVQNDIQNCGPIDTIDYSGTIVTEASAGIPNVEVGFQLSTVTTNQNGVYSIPASYAQPLLLTPSRNNDISNGVTTFDIVLLTKQILGIQPLGSPYKLIAADVNKSGTVTTFDAVLIRQLVLGIITSFPNNTSWRFVPKNYAFPDPTNPFLPPFPETATLNAGNGNTDLDFIGIKIGDLNGSAVPFSASPQERSELKSTLVVPDLYLEKGKSYNLPLAMGQAVTGYQFGLKFNKNNITLNAFEPLVGSLENVVFSNENGWLKTSWNSPDFHPIESGAQILNLQIKANKNGQLHEFLALDKTAMSAESYDDKLSVYELELEFSKTTSLGKQPFQLLPARPNPFKHSTFVGYVLPASGDVNIKVVDTSGRSVWTKNDYRQSGLNEVELSEEQLPATGVYFIQISTPFGTDAQRLVRIK